MKDTLSPSFRITNCHHSACLLMPNDDPQDEFFYPTLTLMINSNNILTLLEHGKKGFFLFTGTSLTNYVLVLLVRKLLTHYKVICVNTFYA